MAAKPPHPSSRTCSCGKPGIGWVLVMVSYPTETRSGHTKGRSFCEQHLAELEDQLRADGFQ
jgi:hypothetical protein